MTETDASRSATKQSLLEQRLRAGRPAAGRGPTSERAIDGAVRPRPAGTAPPLSYAQERLWFMEQLAPHTAAYGVPLQLRFGADIDILALQTALSALLRRHEALRMTFPSTADGRPKLVLSAGASLPLVQHRVPDERQASTVLHALATRSFDLATGPLVRADLIAVGDPVPSDHVLLLDLHHIVTDGWSNEILLEDLAEIYRSERDGRPFGGPPDAPVQYGDFAHWQRERLTGSSESLAYWINRLQGVPALELPLDHQRPPTQTYDGASHHFTLEPELVTALNALAGERRCTLFMVMLAGYQIVLSRFAGQTDFAVGTPVAGRSAPELDRVVGMFVNMLPLRAELADNPSAAQFIDRVRGGVLDALQHQDIPFERVVTDLKLPRDPSRSPLFQAMFVLQNYARPDQPSSVGVGTDIGWKPVELPSTRFELEWHAFATPAGGLACRIIHNTALFDSSTAATLARSLLTALQSLVADPSLPVAELPLLAAQDRTAIETWNATDCPLPWTGPLHDLVLKQARRTPDAVAVRTDVRDISYRTLVDRAEQIAISLAAQGVGNGDVVGVCAVRSAELVAALLGVLLAGGRYLPLDPEYPAERLVYMTEDSGARVVLADDNGRTALCDLPATVITLLPDERWPADRGGGEDRSAAAEHVVSEVDAPDGPAYQIYTSGSTGRPKGVINTHAGIVNRLWWMQQRYRLGPGDVVLQKTPASFDVSVWEFFWPLVTGACVAMAVPGGHKDPAYLARALRRYAVTVAHFVPSMLRVFLSQDVDGDHPADGDRTELSLRQVVCSGEELGVDVVRAFQQRYPDIPLDNLYGPTEAAVDVTAWSCPAALPDELLRIPIGGPMPNCTLAILDGVGQPVPPGVVGELHLGGVQVAAGYHGRPELTAAQFRPDPSGAPGARRYATGDRARWLHDGTVEFLGRIDGQVKLRGLRIELGEIEDAIASLDGVRAAAAKVVELGPGDSRLVGYLVGPAQPDVPGWRTALGRRLPEAMIPTSFVVIDELPLSANGKLDRGALPDPQPATAGCGAVAPRTDLERQIAQVWSGVLGVEVVGVEDNFFDLGGHSLLATQVIAALRPIAEAGGGQLGVMDLFQHPTVSGLAGLLESAEPRTRSLIYRLTPPGRTPVRSYVCVPYGGGSAVVYQPLADALPADHALYAVAIPGHDIGLDEDSLPFDELAQRCTQQILDTVSGPLVLYGHCGVGGALIVELARRLESAGREIEAVYTGGIFPFARPKGRLARLHQWLEDRASNRTHAAWLKSMGVDMDEIDPAQADRIISNMRRDSDAAEEHFTQLMSGPLTPLRAPIISVVGEKDPITDYYQERFREWQFLAPKVALVVLAEAGHFFLKHRAEDVAAVITSTDRELAAGRTDRLPAAGAGRASWWFQAADDATRTPFTAATNPGPGTARPSHEVEPSMRRFATIAAGQLLSATGSQLTSFAVPIWVLQRTGSLTSFGLTGVLAFLPVVLTLPIAGALSDRFDRRRLMMAAGGVALLAELLFAVLLVTSTTPLWTVYGLIFTIGIAGTIQRTAFTAAIPQLVPKRFLGHANGVTQLINGASQLFVPLLAAGLLALIGLRGILIVDVVSYLFALTVLLLVRFPHLLGRNRKDTFWAQIIGGLKLSWGNRWFRAMLIFFGVGNLLYAPALLLASPLILGFSDLRGVGWAGFAEALGALIGGLAMTIWGGPDRRRMRVIMGLIAISGAGVMLAGLRPNLALVMSGFFVTAALLAVANGIYLTIIQLTVPQRFHGRVIALNQTIAWSTFPLGFAIVPVIAQRWLEPAMSPEGALSGSVGALIGTGQGRGVALAYLVFGLAIIVNVLLATRVKRLWNLDTDLHSADPDDLVGATTLAAKTDPCSANQPPAVQMSGTRS